MTKQKTKGTGWERDLVNILNEKINECEFKRIPGSGAIGTSAKEPLLTGDVSGTVKGFPKKIKIEAKVGYGGSTQLTVKKEWINKIIEEAKAAFSFPMLAAKFSGAKKADGVQEFIVMDIDSFIYLANYITDLSNELDEVYKKKDLTK